MSSPKRAKTAPSGTSPPSPKLGFDHVSDFISVDNPKPQKESAPSFTQAGTNGDRLVLVMVGLPATGKTYIARRTLQYLKFFHGAPTKVFNVGNYRRKEFGAKAKHDFFSSSNAEAMNVRKTCASHALDDLKNWLIAGKEVGRVAIFDATNTTRERRDWILEQLKPVVESKRHIVFVESICNEQTTIDANIRATKAAMPDYEGMDEESAVEDFKKRIQHYKDIYQPITRAEDNHLTWVKMFDGGRSISMNNISGFLSGRIVQFLMNLHTIPRVVYLSRHGQSEYNRLGKIGGDSSLSPAGEAYAQRLAKYVHTKVLGLNEDGSFTNPDKRIVPHARLFTSSLERTKQTARHIAHHVCDDGWVCMRPRVWKALDEIYAGVFDGMTYETIKQIAPDEHAARSKDKLTYRYPRGESYLDVIQRLDPIIHDLERQREDVVVVGHQGILRIIYAYMMGMEREEAPHVSIPLNTVIRLAPQTYYCDEERITLGSTGKDADPPSH